MIFRLKTSFNIKVIAITLLLVSLFIIPCYSFAGKTVLFDSANNVTSTRQQAKEYIETITKLESSSHWPNIKPAFFLQNLKTNIDNPISIYPGKATNFCGYGALTYLFLQDDPLGYAKLLMELYRNGKAKFGAALFDPSLTIKLEAGKLKFKGTLDINPAEQMWFLTLAGHFKGYLNIFNRKFDPGDEDRFWASVNYAKFNRMVKNILHFNVAAKGADLMRPKVGDLYDYISKKLQTGSVVLFINNRIVHKKDHITLKLGIPTHFIVAEKISKVDDTITLIYWDYGHKTQMQLTTAFFKRIVFGITHLTKTENDAN